VDFDHKKLKQLLSEGPTSLPPSLEWEQMEAGITEKMAALQPQRSRRWLWWLFLAAGSVILAVIPAAEVLRSVQPAPAQAELTRPADPATEATDRPATAAGTTAVAGTASPARQESPAPDTSSPAVTPSAAPVAASLSPGDPVPPATASVRSAQPLDPAIATAPVDPSTAPGSTANDPSSLSDKMDGQPAAPSAGSLQPAVAVLATRGPALLTAERALPAPLPGSTPAEPENGATAGRRLVLLGGPTIWSPGYGTTQPERASFERSLPSYQAEVNLLQPLGKRWQLLVGFQYQQLESRFDWRNTLTDYTITLQDTVIQRQTNALTGAQTEVRGDVELTVPAERIVRHYNTTRLYQLPIALGTGWTHGRWQTEDFLGGALTLASNHRGRTLFQGSLTDYTGPRTGFQDSQWQVDALLAGRVSYRLNELLQLTTGLQWQKNLTNWSTETGITMRPQSVNWSLGVQYRW
jgi:hypothetical protein